MSITKEQFGLSLYEAIKACAAAEYVGRMAQNAKTERERSQRQKQHKAAVIEAKKAANSMICSDADAARLVKQYPWVME